MADINGVFDSIFSSIGKITGFVRGIIDKMAPEYSNLVYLALAGLAAYYIVQKMNANKSTPPVITGYWVYILIGSLIFLVLKKV